MKEFLASTKQIWETLSFALGLAEMPKPEVVEAPAPERARRKKSAPIGRKRMTYEADKKTKGTGPSQSPRKSGPAGKDTSGKAGPGGGKVPPGLTPDAGKVSRGQKSFGSGGKTGTKDPGPTTSAGKTGTLKKKPK
jgi:hypothetical protein